jgi:cell division protein FtsW
MERRAAIILCLSVATLVALGLVMLASTSAWAPGVDEDPYVLVKRQGVWTGVGLFAALATGCLDYRILRRIWLPILIVACILVALCYVPGVKVEAKGEARWIGVPIIGRFQPSEVAKIAVIIALAAWFAQYQAEAKSFFRGFVLPGILLGIPVGLIFFEKDMGTAMALGGAGFLLMFTAGTRVSLLVLTGVVDLKAGIGQESKLHAWLNGQLCLDVHDTCDGIGIPGRGQRRVGDNIATERRA